ncbi:uncharacterized protein LOC131873980 [Cryptomeria japonica]|uniref:uncharacterized protein LOC131873980 n=1 Tax=Cryptomeria japonica TaxID=3369 RepID=UPI0027DA4445|nr:uncharacterized protein LOC131873980 [Cryptomeria japonica]
MKVHNQLDAITHSQFADDTIIFGDASLVEDKNIMSTLNFYSEQSRQVMNKGKSQLFLNTNKQVQQRISNLLGIKVSELPIKYLGIRIKKGCRQSQIWEDVLKSCSAKTEFWKNRWLTQAGRLTMVKFVLSAIPIYYMSFFKMPFAAGKNIDNLLRKFVWEGAKDTKKIPLINWDTMCLLKEDGRAGLRKMELQNIALGAKLSWKMYIETMVQNIQEEIFGLREPLLNYHCGKRKARICHLELSLGLQIHLIDHI